MLVGIGIAAGVLLGLVVLTWVALGIVGRCMPAEHVTMRSLRLAQTPEAIWLVLTDFPQVPRWNPNVREIERLPDRHGHPVWRETYRNRDQLSLETTEAMPPRRLVRVIADQDLPYRGSWEIAIEPAGVSSRVTITERGEIPSPQIRVMFRLFHDPAKTMEEYLEALATRFGERARLEGRDEADSNEE